MSRKEQQRVMILNQVERRELKGGEAAGLLGLSLRQVRRLLAAYREEGVAALAHGNRGRRPAHTVDQAVRQQVVALAQERYASANHTQLTELLAEREGIMLSRSTVRRFLRGAGLRSPRARRPPRHLQRRQRAPQAGMLLQIDGSPHDWLEDRGPRLTLIAAVDDATGAVPAAVFREQEDAHGYFLLLREIIQHQGVPVALYSDRHGIFPVNPKRPLTVEEELRGAQAPTQFGRALEELGIQRIVARSPQAKGRIERLFGTLQDRLVLELHLAGATTMQEANAVLLAYLPHFNAQFSVPAAQPCSAYRPLPEGRELDGVRCFKEQRTVANDNTVRCAAQTLQLLPDAHRASYARSRVEVQRRLDGGLVVCYQGRVLTTQRAPADAVVQRGAGLGAESSTPQQPAVSGNGYKPAPDHPWRRFWNKKPRGDKITEPLR